MRINHNLMALNAHRQLGISNMQGQKALEKLSSGLRINRAADDAAGLAISEKMRGQIRGLNQASRNAQDGISLIQTAEGALNESHSILQRMRELAVQSSNDTNTSADRQKIQQEVDELAKELSRITNTTEFNTKNLLAGGFSNQKFQIGANEGQDIAVGVGAMDAFSLGVTSGKGTTTLSGTSVTSSSLSASATIASGVYTVDGTVTTAATSAQVTGTAAATLDQSAATAANRTISLEVDNTTQIDIIVDATNFASAADLIANVQSKIDADASLKGKVTVADDGTGKLQFTAASKGVNSTLKVWGGGTNTLGLATAEPASANAGANAVYTLNLKDSNGTVVESLATQSTYSVAFTNGLTVNTSESLLESLAANEAISASEIDVVNGESKAAVTGSNGLVVEDSVVAKGILVNTQANANSAVDRINSALEKVSTQRSSLGALQNRLEYTISNLDTAAENLQAAESRVRDVDMAKEMMEFTRTNILQQAGTAMLAQANAKPQSVLQLLG
jgi:flagellin